MKTYEAIRPVLLTRVVPAYAALGGLGLAYALGSLVEDLATQADLDLVLVWDGLIRKWPEVQAAGSSVTL